MTVITKYEKPCSDCDNGYIQSLAWQNHFRELEKLRNKYEKQGMTFHEADERAWEELRHLEPDEPEEDVCSECEGKGVLPTEEGRELLIFIGRYL